MIRTHILILHFKIFYFFFKLNSMLFPVSCPVNMDSKTSGDKEVLCCPPTVPVFWESGFQTMGLNL